MAMTHDYAATEPSRAEIDALAGPVLLEFGSASCGWCIRAQSLLKSAFATHPEVRHIKIEDGSGQPLGRSFGVKLWPTLVFLQDGREVTRLVRPSRAQPREVTRLVRPSRAQEVAEAFERIDPAA